MREPNPSKNEHHKPFIINILTLKPFEVNILGASQPVNVLSLSSL